jgi:hypothetical protein
MIIEFELNEKQSAIMAEILALPANQGKTAEDLVKQDTIGHLTSYAQQKIAEELAK